MKTLRVIAAAFAASLGISGLAAAERLQLIDPPSSTNAKSATAAQARSHGRGVLRARDAQPNFAALRVLHDAVRANPGVPQEIELPAFADVSLVLAIDKVEELHGTTSYYGHVAGDPLSTATIVEARGMFAVNVVRDGKGYQVVYRGNTHEAREIDRSAFDGPDEPTVPRRDPRPEASGDAGLLPGAKAGAVAAADDGTLIDVMVLYSPATRAAAGGQAAIENQIDLAVASTNQAYANGGLVQRIRLVHSQEIAYAEPSTPALDATLDAITDGVAPFQGVAALRSQYGADLVAMWVENGGPWCGIGWLMTSVSTSFAPNGFHVGVRDCEVSYDTMAHEMGHNMGLEHDLYVSPQSTHPTAQPYAHGFVSTAGRFRTIMAYGNQCTDAGFNCQRINQFSSPSYQLSGYPIGNATTADAGRMLNLTRTTVANFRASVPTVATMSLASTAYTVAESAGGVNLVVNRTGSTTGASSVTWTTANGTAVAGQDFGLAGSSSQRSGTISFAAGETSKTISVNIINDATLESNESFSVSLSNPAGGVVGTTSASTVTITSEESAFGVTAAALGVNEVGPNIALRVTRTGSLAAAASVTYTTTDGTAVAGTDFGTAGSTAQVSGVLSFAVNQSYRDILIGPTTAVAPYIRVVNDTLAEGPKTFTVTLSSPTGGATLGTAKSTVVTINSDDVATTPGANTVQLSASTVGASEGANVTLAVTRTGNTVGNASVTWRSANGTAIAGTDFGTLGNATAPSGTLTWAAGDAATKTITIPVINDTVVDGARSFSVALSAPGGTGVTVGSIAATTVTINDNDSGLAFASATYKVVEGTKSLAISVNRVGTISTKASVRWATANGSALVGKDFGLSGATAQLGGLLSWPAGDGAAKTIVIPIINDTLAEGDETFTLILSTPTGAALGSLGTATVTIEDNDAAPGSQARFSQPKYVVLESAGSVAVTVNRVDSGGGFGTSASVTYATQSGTALTTSDFTTKSGTLAWAAGDSSPKTIVIPVVNDAIAESPETFRVTLAGASGMGVATPEATVLVLDDDEAFPLDAIIPSGWVMPAGAAASWHVSNDPGAYEGAFSLKSDEVDDGETAEIQVARTFAAGTISFRAKVSSEPGFDALRFYVDGVVVGTWSGTTNTGWQLFSYPLPAGAHTLKWAYEKDPSASLGQDAAWIDGVTLP
jgi:hypothetical protein